MGRFFNCFLLIFQIRSNKVITMFSHFLQKSWKNGWFSIEFSFFFENWTFAIIHFPIVNWTFARERDISLAAELSVVFLCSRQCSAEPPSQPSRPAMRRGIFFREFRFPCITVPSVPPYRYSHVFWLFVRIYSRVEQHALSLQLNFPLWFPDGRSPSSAAEMCRSMLVLFSPEPSSPAPRTEFCFLYKKRR